MPDVEKQEELRIVGFLCNWCSYGGADTAGVSRFKQPTDLRIIRVPCSGRVDPLFVAKAFAHGADGVLVSGCHPRDCHYSDGNFYARRRLEMLKRFLPFIGIDDRRFHYTWVSASEGQRWQQTVTEFTRQIHELGPASNDRTNEEIGKLNAEQLKKAVAEALPNRSMWSSATGRASTRPRRAVLHDEAGAGGRASSSTPCASITSPPTSPRTRSGSGGGRQGLRHPGPSSSSSRKGLSKEKTSSSSACPARASCREKAEPRHSITGGGSRALRGRTSSSKTASGREEARPCRYLPRQVRDLPISHAAHLRRARGRADRVGQDRRMRSTTTSRPSRANALEERRAYWEKELGRCIRCYACRNACPLCVCKESCIAETRDPHWMSQRQRPTEKMMFHLIHALHLAGRCTECGECERACPMNIPLGKLKKKINMEMLELFGYTAGRQRRRQTAPVTRSRWTRSG